MSLTMAHWKHQSARSSLLDHRVRPGPEPESNWPWSSTCPLDWSWRPCSPRAHCLPRRAPPMGTSAQTRVNNTSEEEEYDEGMPKEEEGITYYIRYCPEDNSYQQGTDCSRLPGPPGDATWRWMSARKQWRSGRSQGPATPWRSACLSRLICGPSRHKSRPKLLNLPPEAKHFADAQRSFKTKTRTPEERPMWPQEESTVPPQQRPDLPTSPSPLACFCNTSVEQERTEPARTKDTGLHSEKFWISPGPDHHVATEIGHGDLGRDPAWPLSWKTPCLHLNVRAQESGAEACCLFSSLPPRGSPSLGLLEVPQVSTCRPPLLSRDQTCASSPRPAPGVCFVNTSVEQERTEPARTKHLHHNPSSPLNGRTPSEAINSISLGLASSKDSKAHQPSLEKPWPQTWNLSSLKVKVADIAPWIHHTRAKKAYHADPEDADWTIQKDPTGPRETKIILKRKKKTRSQTSPPWDGAG
ncbi:uncharacterized protein LOC122706321 [Cervus elaphus]|uniref:uncharacterized protein LOC122454857 n=1 Tax=Cervus canadensis TaxID=1574408 RepID=UPI001C9E7812|nr:uncharacterized protein LOC122454857 [Cervus canadensis]XP_043777401.1 uncharacterized protein LOC122706321 [Cervus elaphus]